MSEQLTADARCGVMDLIAGYVRSLEAGDLEGYLDRFTRDGVFEVRDRRYEGREDIRALVSHLYAIGQDGPGGNRHVLGLPHITGTSQACEALTYVAILPGQGAAGGRTCSFAQYADRMVRDEGRWRFAHRRLVVISRGGAGG